MCGDCCDHPRWVGFNDAPRMDPFLFQCMYCHKMVANMSTCLVVTDFERWHVHPRGVFRIEGVVDVEAHSCSAPTEDGALLMGFFFPVGGAPAWGPKVVPALFLAKAMLAENYTTRTLPPHWHITQAYHLHGIPAPTSSFWAGNWGTLVHESTLDRYYWPRMTVSSWPLPTDPAACNEWMTTLCPLLHQAGLIVHMSGHLPF